MNKFRFQWSGASVRYGVLCNNRAKNRFYVIC